MAWRKQVTKQTTSHTDETIVDMTAVQATNLDDILDQIDHVLETNAEAFVKNFVQKGGQ